MSEKEFTLTLVNLLQQQLKGFEIETGKSLLYSLFIDEYGNIPLGLNAKGEPTRGGGTGFEQDLLIFERKEGQITIVPRVVAEVKFRGVTTHDALVYSEKARRIRSIYPYLRYGLILGEMKYVPPRVLRLGAEFDFMLRVDNPPGQDDFEELVEILLDELEASRKLGQVFSGKSSVAIFRKRIDVQPDPFVVRRTKDDHGIRKKELNQTSAPNEVSYYIYENWVAENKARIHYGHCSSCNNGQGAHPGSSNRNGLWHGPFANYDSALEAANATHRQVSNCKVCRPK